MSFEEGDQENHLKSKSLKDLVINVIQNGGSILDSVTFCDSSRTSNDEGYGVFSKSYIEKNSVIMSIPFSMCISSSLVSSNSQLMQIFADNPGLLDYPDEVVSVGLMWAKSLGDNGEKSVLCPWFTHVMVIPFEFNTTLFWSPEELEELKPSAMYQLTKLLKNQIYQDWNQIYLPLKEQYPTELGHITLDLYTWALSVIYSRAVGFERRGQYVRIIPPLIDMANHSPKTGRFSGDTFNYNDAIDHVQYLSQEDRQPNEECFAIYGSYPNSKLLYTYGFVIQGCPDKAIDLWARVTPSSTSADVKQRLLESHQLTRNQTYDFTGTIRENYVSPALLATIRIIQMTADELEQAELAFVGRMISYRNELATYGALKALLISRMKVETAEMDRMELGEMLLSGVKLSDRKVMALIVRVEERELIQDVVTLVDSWIESLVANGESYVPPDATTIAEEQQTNNSNNL